MKHALSKWLYLLLALALVAAACSDADDGSGTSQADTTPTTATTTTEEADGDSATDEPTDDVEEVVLTFWWEGAAVGNLEVFQQSFARYQEMNPHVTIEVSAIPFEDMLRTFPLALDGGTGPDVSMSLPLESTTFPAAQAGHLLDLGPIGQERGWFEKYDTNALDVNNRGLGGVFGIPYEWTVVGVYYNTEIFESLGLEPPTSFAEFEAILAAVHDAGIIPISVGALDGWPLMHVWQALAHGNVDYEVLRGLEDKDPSYSYEHPGLIEAADKVVEWAQAGYLDPNAVSTNFVDANNLFISGQAAMNVGGTWVQSDFRGAPFEVGFFAMPMMNPDLPARMGGFTPANDIVVVAGGDNVDEAVDLVEYLVSEENMQFFWESGLLVPFIFDTAPAGVDRLQEDIYAAMISHLPGHFIGVSAPETARVTWAGMQEIVSGARSVADVFAEIQQTYLTEAG